MRLTSARMRAKNLNIVCSMSVIVIELPVVELEQHIFALVVAKVDA